MKTKIYKICGVALALVMVFSLMGAFVPASDVQAQAWTANRWNNIGVPSPGGMKTNPGGSITDFAVGPDGFTIYVVDGVLGAVYKSPSGGGHFANLNIPAVVGTLTKIAVAPDNPDVVAYVDNAGAGVQDIVYISTNGGATWSNLSFAAGNAAETIADIAVSPARAGTLFGRDYVVVTNNPAGGAFGNIYVVGTTATWTTYPAVTALALDFTSVALAPNWVGDRVVLGVGSGAVAGGNAELGGANGDTWLVAVNTATGSLAGPATVRLDAAAGDSPPEIGGGGAAIVSSSIALPKDFDSTSVGNFRAYVGWTSTPVGVIVCADDVYRVDFNSVRKLEVRPAVGVYSLSYFGTVGSGTLMVGESANTQVWFSSDPMSGMPTWGAGSAKPPTGTNNAIVWMTSATDAYAGTAGADSGFHKTEDGGISFNGITLINETIAVISDIMPSPDGSTLFMASSDAAVGGNWSLWRGVGFPNPGSWDRVQFRTAAQFTGTNSIIRLSPDYKTDTTVYWFDAGTGAGFAIRRSTDGGQIWGGRTLPAAIRDATVESQDILYVTDGAAGNVYASTNGAWFFGLPVNAGIGPLNTINMAPSYPNKPKAGNLLVGGSAVAGGVCLSTDGAASFRPLLSFTAGLPLVVYGDEDYASNNIVYAGDNTGVWRYVVNSSSAWEQIRNSGAAVTGIGAWGGVFYASWNLGGASGVDRSMMAWVPEYAGAFWDTMNVGSGAATFNAAPTALRISAAGNDAVAAWAVDTTAITVYAYLDDMALWKPTVNVPDVVPFDSVTGGSSQFSISWDNHSNALMWEVQIFTDAAGSGRVFTSGTTFVPPFPLAPEIVIPVATLVGGQNYWVEVKCRDQVPGDAIRSLGSGKIKFSVAAGERVEVSYLGVQPLGPTPGAIGVPLTPGFTWSPYADTTMFEFQLASDSAFANILASAEIATTGYKYDGTLDYNTTYFWRVRGIEPVASDWSPVSSFTTEKKPAEPTPPVVVETPPAAEPVVTPAIIWAIIAIGAILVVAVIVLIVRTRTRA